MTWKMYIFVRTKDHNGKRFSKGKLAGQVGHVCWKLGNYTAMETAYRDDKMDYLNNIYIYDGEIKLVFKVDELPFTSYHPLYEESDVKYYKYREDILSGYSSAAGYSATVRDKTTGEYIALAVLTAGQIDTSEMKLL